MNAVRVSPLFVKKAIFNFANNRICIIPVIAKEVKQSRLRQTHIA